MASGGDDKRDFRSKSFNPSLVLSSANVSVPVEDAEEYEDLNALRTTVHGRGLNVVREIPGVLGPGGIPQLRVVAPVPVDRNFTADQGLIRGRGPRRQRNVLNRMEEIRGPLAVLRRCKEENIRVKVYTRNQCEIRGILTGYVVAFDKHWNLALRDVDEIFQRKIRCKTPALGDVSEFIRVGDLTIRGNELSSDSESEQEEFSVSGQRASARGTSGYHSGERGGGGGRGQREEEEAPLAAEEGRPSTSSYSVRDPGVTMSSSSRSRDRALQEGGRWEGSLGEEEGKGTKMKKKKKKLEFTGPYSVESLDQRARSSMPVSRENPLTSEAQDALKLSLSQRKHGRNDDNDNNGQEDPPEAETQPEGGETSQKKKKRLRKRKKREIRKRHVNQLFIRGENVVLIIADE